jgi:hypothetical protein
MKDITIKLNEDQRFMIESVENCGVMLVDEIYIMPNGMQMNFSGKYFDLDFEKMSISGERPMNMNIQYTENAMYGNDDQ